MKMSESPANHVITNQPALVIEFSSSDLKPRAILLGHVDDCGNNLSSTNKSKLAIIGFMKNYYNENEVKIF